MERLICNECGDEIETNGFSREFATVEIYGLNYNVHRTEHYCNRCWKTMKKAIKKLNSKSSQ